MARSLIRPPNCACFNIRRASRKLTQAFEHALRPAEIQPTQFTLLAMLDGISRDQGIPTTVLAEHLGLERTTLTRNLSLTEQHGWTTTNPSEDRRERLIKLTPEGEAKLQEAIPYWQAAQTSVVDVLGKNGLTELLELTDRINAD